MFVLHAQLSRDCAVIGDLALSRVLLMNDSRFPWLILVPRREEVSELFELSTADQRVLMEETIETSSALAAHARADKMNVAALGNIVSQLHVHVVARHREDAAWPGPVWGCGTATAYGEEAFVAITASMTELLLPFGLQPA